jgi:hypothetical protein
MSLGLPTGTQLVEDSSTGNVNNTPPGVASQVAGSDGTNLRVLKVSSTGVLSVDGSAVPLPTGTNTIGSVKITDGTTVPGVIAGTTALKTDNSSIAGTATAVASAGIQKVGVVGSGGAIFDAATGAAVPANVVLAGARAATANPTNATGGNAVSLMADKAGRLVVTEGTVRELIAVQQTAVSGTGETTIVTAAGANVFADLMSLIITTLKDSTGGTTRAVFNYPNAASAPSTPLVINFNPPLPQSGANANWTLTASAAAGAVNVTAVYAKNS